MGRSRARASSTSESGSSRPRSGSTSSTKSRTTATSSLMEESNRMRALAATAAAKAQQRKMTDFLGSSEQVRQQVPPGGAGELPSGPRDPVASLSGSGQGQADEEAARIQEQIRLLREQQDKQGQSDADKLIEKFKEQDRKAAAEKAAAAATSQSTGEDEGGVV